MDPDPGGLFKCGSGSATLHVTCGPLPHISQEYRDWARYYLTKKFPNLATVDAVLDHHNGHFLPAWKQLSSLVKMAKRPAAGLLPRPERPNPTFLREYIYLKLEADIQEAVTRRQQQRERRVAAAKRSGAVFECACCFDEDCPLDEVSFLLLHVFCYRQWIQIEFECRNFVDLDPYSK